MAHVFAYPASDAIARAHLDPTSVEAAYRLASGGSHQAIRSALEAGGRASTTQRTILASAVDLLSGHVSRGLHALKNELDVVTAGDRPYLVDLIAPLYVMLDRFDELHGLLDSVPAGHPVAAGIAALRVVRDARAGRRVAVLCAIEDLSTYVDVGHDDLLVGKVAQRLALAAYYVKAYELATDLAEKSVHAYRRVDAARLAVTSYSIIYNVHHAVTGNCEESLRAAQLMTEFAKAAGDRSYQSIGLVAQYEIAAEMGDADRLNDLRAEIRREAVPEQFRERFACRIADFLPFAWDGNFAALRTGLSIARDALDVTAPMRALATALMALADCALGNEAESRRLVRSSISLASLTVSERETAYDFRYRLLARAIAASTSVLLGARDRAERALNAKAYANDADLAVLVDIARGRDYRELSVRTRGYSRAVYAAREKTHKSKLAIDLTRTELAVLQLLAEGMTAAQIARHMGRSIFTIRNHTRSIIDKCDVSGRVAAVSFARKQGLLD